MCTSRAALAAGIMRWWSPTSSGQGGGCRANLLPWIQEGRLAPSGIYLVEYHGVKPWREEGAKRAVIFRDVQGSPLPGSGVMHPHREEAGQKCQETLCG